MAAKAEQITA